LDKTVVPVDQTGACALILPRGRDFSSRHDAPATAPDVTMRCPAAGVERESLAGDLSPEREPKA